MSDLNETPDSVPAAPQATPVPDPAETEFSPQWAKTAPRGGRTVLNRILKDGMKVPMFMGQTLINSLRDLGYNSTTSALCEHVDNAIQWGASEVRVYFHQTGKKGGYRIDTLVLDNGQGMVPNVLKVATSFGGSMVYDNRGGIGRYGMGMKTAALHLSRVLDVYSWQEPGAYYNMILDVDAISKDRNNMIEMRDPVLCNELPSAVVEILTKPLSYPKNPRETQTLFAESEEELREQLGRSGTLIYLPDCDRMSPRKAQTLAEEATREMGRIYRRFIDRGLRLYVNNRRVEAFDPTYWMKSARHTRIEGLTETRSRLVGSWPIDIPVAEPIDSSVAENEDEARTTRITVRLYALPYEAWSGLPYQAKKDLHLSNDHTVSFLRNDRELEIGSVPLLKLKKHHDNSWLRLEIDFNGEADEGFGVAANKQGVRLKKYVADRIVKQIGNELIALKKVITELKAKHATLKTGSQVSEAERRASDAEPFQAKQLPEVPVDTPEQRAALEQNLRGLAVTLKRDEETEDQAFERIKSSTHLIATKHDEYRPFYTDEYRYGKVILTLNSAHPFFQKIWQPLSNLAVKTADISQEGHDAADETAGGVAATAKEVLVEIQLLLLELARTQSELSGHDGQSMNRQLFTTMQRVWSANYATASLAH